MVLQTGWPRANFDFYAVSWHGGHVCRFNQLHFVYKRCFRIETVLAGVKLEWMHSLKKDERISSYPEYPMR